MTTKKQPGQIEITFTGEPHHVYRCGDISLNGGESAMVDAELAKRLVQNGEPITYKGELPADPETNDKKEEEDV